MDLGLVLSECRRLFRAGGGLLFCYRLWFSIRVLRRLW
nr:MAG TPA: hypothetical protein [Caudoviricetes sp.]